MAAFDDTAWRQIAALPVAVLGEAAEMLRSPAKALTAIFEGWETVLVEENPRVQTILTTRRAATPVFVVFSRPEICVAVLVQSCTPTVDATGHHDGWRGWIGSSRRVRGERLAEALHSGSLMGPDLMGVVEQMTQIARKVPDSIWRGYPERLVPFALERLDPDKRAAYAVLAGLGAYAT